MEGFVYALIEREFIKTGESIIKVGMSRKSPEERLRGYPKGSHYIWVRDTPFPVRDERTILASMLSTSRATRTTSPGCWVPSCASVQLGESLYRPTRRIWHRCARSSTRRAEMHEMLPVS